MDGKTICARTARARLVAYVNGGSTEFPAIEAADAATATAAAEDVARRLVEAGRVDDDSEFFAYLDGCAAAGAKAAERWAPTRRRSGNYWFASFVGDASAFRDADVVVIANASAKSLAIEREDAAGALEGYVVEPGGAATFAGGRAVGREPEAKEERRDGRHVIPCPFRYKFEWIDPDTGNVRVAEEVGFARLSFEAADESEFAKAANVRGVDYYAYRGRFYIRRTHMADFVAARRSEAAGTPETFAGAMNEKEFADMSDEAAARGERIERLDCSRKKAEEIEKYEKWTKGCVEALGKIWLETRTPTYVAYAHGLAIVDVPERRERAQDATSSIPRVIQEREYFPLAEREEAVKKAVEYAKRGSSKISPDDLPRVEIFDAEIMSRAPWRE